MKYFITNAPLTILEENGHINWEGFGFSPSDISTAVSMGSQQQDDDRLVSIFPIADETLLRGKLGETIGTTNASGDYFKIVTEAEAFAERDRLKAINAIAEEIRRNTPTDDDVFKAQQLKLLTEISMKLGGGANV